MKRFITLSIAALAFTASYAQSSQEESRRVILGKQDKKTEEAKKDDNSGKSVKDIVLGRRSDSDDGTISSTERQTKIDRINRDYDNKIQSIRNNPNLSAEEKERIIAGLEKERARKIREVNNEYKNKDRDDDDDDNKGKKDKKDKVKSNNGKHLGWEKGVGNPHRSDSDKKVGKDKDRDDDDDDKKGKDKSKSKGKNKKG